MIHISKIFLYITIAGLLMWQLPWCYNFFAPNGTQVPFTIYSGVCEDFISIAYNEELGEVQAKSRAGHLYTLEEADSLLPFFYMRQLMADGRFPDTIQGVAVTPQQVRISNFNYRVTPQDVNVNKAGLYPLLETMSGRVDLEMSDDVFRITKQGIEFVKMKENTIDEQKSEVFTKMMKSKGFVFPARIIAGNPTTRKDYDEGYLLLDNESRLFHMKKTRGRPYVRPIGLPDSLMVKNLFITEFPDHKTLAYIVDMDNRFYVLENKTYKVYRSGVDVYDPKLNSLTVFGNMLDMTVTVTSDDEVCVYALNADDYSLIDKMIIPVENYKIRGLHFTSFKDKYVKPRF